MYRLRAPNRCYLCMAPPPHGLPTADPYAGRWYVSPSPDDAYTWAVRSQLEALVAEFYRRFPLLNNMLTIEEVQ